MLRIGLTVNPIAGLGGPAALKGTDGVDAPGLALAAGIVPQAGLRAEMALAALRRSGAPVEIIAAPGPLTCAADTIAAAQWLAAQAVDVIAFAGGDGTARDVLKGSGGAVPLLGIPAGVKMYSGVFALSPQAAGDLLAAMARAPAAIVWREAEVIDVDEAEPGSSASALRLYGYARTPHERRLMQNPKARAAASGEAGLRALAAEIATGMAPDLTYLIGPGSTTFLLKQRLGVAGALLGVDAVRDGRLLGGDLTRAGCDALAGAGPLTIVVTVIGGQGFLFGRGNQQIGAAAIARAGRDGIIVMAGADKLSGLNGRLHADTGDAACDRLISGYLRVHTAPHHSTMMRVCPATIWP